MKQATPGLNLSTKRTCRREFPDEMDRVVPWAELTSLIEPYYPKGKIGFDQRVRVSAEWCSAYSGSEVASKLCCSAHASRSATAYMTRRPNLRKRGPPRSLRSSGCSTLPLWHIDAVTSGRVHPIAYTPVPMPRVAEELPERCCGVSARRQ